MNVQISKKIKRKNKDNKCHLKIRLFFNELLEVSFPLVNSNKFPFFVI